MHDSTIVTIEAYMYACKDANQISLCKDRLEPVNMHANGVRGMRLPCPHTLGEGEVLIYICRWAMRLAIFMGLSLRLAGKHFQAGRGLGWDVVWADTFCWRAGDSSTGSG